MKKAKREKAEGDDDRRLRPLHMFGDVGPPIAEADYRPRIHGNPVETLRAALISMGRDYSGPLSSDFVLRAVLTPEA